MGMNTPVFSIIIPVRNEAKRLSYCLPSLLKQTFSDFEIILVEDPHTSDTTKEYVESLTDDRIKYIVHEPGLRVPAKRNIGSQHASGTYIYNIDADMEFPQETLASIHKTLIDGEYDILFVKECTPGEDFVSRMKNTEKHIIQEDMSLTAARIYKKEVFDHLGGYKHELMVGEEVDLSDRAVDAGYKAGLSDAMINHYETSGASFFQHMKKKFIYGTSVVSYFSQKYEDGKKDANNETAVKRSGSSRLIYFTSPLVWKNPIKGLIFSIFKFIEFCMLGFGMIWGILSRKTAVTSRG